jgi:type IX secretion system PorP/SprF family membrane protein
MKYLAKLIVIVFLFAANTASAQDFPYHYFSNSNPMVNNPSFAAAKSQMRGDAGTYNLWAGGFKPVNDYMVSFSMSPDFRKRGKPSWYDTRVGLGAVFLSEKMGPFTQNIFQLIYAYHIPIDKSTFLSLGICAAVENLNVDVNILSPLYPDDPRLLNGNNNAIIIDGGFGAAVHGKNYTLSFSSLNLAGGDFNFNNNSAQEINNYRKFYLTANYNFQLSKNVHFQPFVTLRNSRVNSLNFDTSAAFNLTWLVFGAGYRSESSVFVFTKIPFNDFYIAYTSENPLGSKHMVGNGHIFSFGWEMKAGK